MQTKSKIIFITLLAILALAAYFRFWQIWLLPGGLYSDEGANGLDVLDILSGKNISVFYERNYGREGLFFYLLALSVKLLGVGVWQMKIVSGIVSLVTIFGLYLLAKQLFNRHIALLSCFFAAVSIPYTIFSRVAFRANLVPCILTYLFYFGIKTLRSKENKYLYAFLSGAMLALGFYTYIAFRIVPFLILALLVLAEIITRRLQGSGFIWPKRKIIATSLTAFLITISPLAYYFGEHPESFWGRSNDVSILNPALSHSPIYYLGRNIGRTITMFNLVGDYNWRHNISGAPFFDPATGILFLIGFIVSIFLWLKSIYALAGKRNPSLRKIFWTNTVILGWLATMLVPMLTTEESIPHFLRSIGIMPIIFIFPALGTQTLFLKIRYRPIVITFLLLTIIVFVANYNLYMYFKVAKNSPGYYSAYLGDLTLVSNYINQIDKPQATFLVLDEKADRTVRFLTSPRNNPYTLVEPNKTSEPKYPVNARVVFPSLSFSEAAGFCEIYPGARLIHEEYNRFGKKAMEVYAIQLKVQN